jgi:hypothetical protein
VVNALAKVKLHKITAIVTIFGFVLLCPVAKVGVIGCPLAKSVAAQFPVFNDLNS